MSAYYGRQWVHAMQQDQRRTDQQSSEGVRMMTSKRIPCGDLQGGVSCDVPATVSRRGLDRVGYVVKGCGCGRVTTSTYKQLPRGHRLG